jgi:hypothetical protein
VHFPTGPAADDGTLRRPQTRAAAFGRRMRGGYFDVHVL